MKRFTVIVVSTLCVGVSGLVLAQVKTPTPNSGQKPAVSTASSQPTGNPAVHNVNLRLREDMMQIQKDLHAGKLTKTQATALQAQVKAVRTQELGFMKSNGKKQLTDDQTGQLNQSLGQLEPSL